MPQTQTEEIEIIIIVEVLDIQQGTVEIGGQEAELGKEEDWNTEIIDKKELKRKIRTTII